MKKIKTKIPEEAEETKEALPAEPEAEKEAPGEAKEALPPEAEQEKPASPENEGDEEGMREDVALFRELFPEVKAKEIPAEVWERVEKGESLAASFALYRLQQEKREAHIKKVNEENEASAPPRIRHDGTDGSFFTPEMVKNMTAEEVRKNYKQILKSMDQWN